MGFDRSNCDGEVELASIFVKSMMLRFRNNAFTCWLLNYCPDESFERIDIDQEVERILADKPRLRLPDVNSEGEKLRVLHVTDIHFDPKYIEGSLVEFKLEAYNLNLNICRYELSSPSPKTRQSEQSYVRRGACTLY